MIQAVKERVTIQPGGRIELEHPDLPAGAEAEVIVIVELTADSTEMAPGTDKAGKETISAEQVPDYRELIQASNSDEADRWSWDWTGPDQDLLPRILPRETDGEE